MSGGANFSPQLEPRPKYPPFFSKVLLPSAKYYLKMGILCTALAKSSHHYVLAAIKYLLKRGWTERQIWTLFFASAHGGSWITIGGFYLFCQKMGWFSKYEMKRQPHQVPSEELWSNTWKEALTGQIAGVPVAYLVYKLFKKFGMPGLTDKLPSDTKLFGWFILCNVFNDFFFYWTHRMFHHPKLYKYHKQHHSYTGTISLAAEFAGQLESVVSNVFPTIGGCLFFGAHPHVFWSWVVARLYQTYENHSGFCFKGSALDKYGFAIFPDLAAFHDFHHTGNCGNFGSTLIMDWLCGTMDSWVEVGMTEGYVKKVGTVGGGSKSLN